MVKLKTLRMTVLLGAVFASQLLPAQSPPSFSGVWKLSNDRSQPTRKGDVTLKIDQRGSEFTVETKILRGSESPRNSIHHHGRGWR